MAKSQMILTFREAREPAKPAKDKFRSSLSAIEFADDGETLFLGGDETVEATPSLERLVRSKKNRYGGSAEPEHESLAVEQYLDLPDNSIEDGRKGEIDIEGLSIADGWLWLLGSHSTNRKNLDGNDGIEKLERVSRGLNRYFLGRIPAVVTEGRTVLEKSANGRTASRLQGEAGGGALITALATDGHLGPFLQPVCKDKHGNPTTLPGKDNGFDLEGLAVAGGRVFVGLRGPVLRQWAVILELSIDPEGDVALKPNSNGRLYRKHFIKVHGLGIRDIAVQDDDLLLLAGPTMGLDGPARIYRWSRALSETAANAADTRNDLSEAARIELPYGNGDDHAEGMALIPKGRAPAEKVLVVYDSPAMSRCVESTGVRADVFRLP